MIHHLRIAGLIGVLALTLAIGLPYRLAQADDGTQYFPETRHRVRPPFIQFFNQTGGVLQHGFPITDDYVDPQTGLLVQYFEKSRFEWHPGNPEPYRVQLGLLGDELGKRTAPIPLSQIPAAHDPNCQYYDATGHSVCLKFLDYFERHGGIDRFGYPITEWTIEGDRITQYFQRAEMQWYPEKPASQRVQLVPLGRQYYMVAGLDPRRMTPDWGGFDMAGVRAITARGSVINSVAVTESAQTTFVFVTDQLGIPVPGAAVTLVVHYPNGDAVFTLPPTSTSGTTFQTFTVPPTKAGTIVSMDFIIGYNGVFAQTRTSYMVWY